MLFSNRSSISVSQAYPAGYTASTNLRGRRIREFPAAGIYGLRFWKVVLLSTVGLGLIAIAVCAHIYMERVMQMLSAPEEFRKFLDLRATESFGNWLRTLFYTLSALTAWGLSGFRYRVILPAATPGGPRTDQFDGESVWSYVVSFCWLLAMGNATSLHRLISPIMTQLTGSMLIPGVVHAWWIIPTLAISSILAFRVFCVLCFSGFATLFQLAALIIGAGFCLVYLGYELPTPRTMAEWEFLALTLIGPWCLLTSFLLHASWVVNAGDLITATPRPPIVS